MGMGMVSLSSRICGAPVDVAIGSLGQGSADCVGVALVAKRLGRPLRIWVLCGDGEMAEGVDVGGVLACRAREARQPAGDHRRQRHGAVRPHHD
jgi:hypothetical protein